jgi:hypothetical protein
MADCELIDGCMFFNNKMQNMPATAGLVKDKFCKGDFASCARYRVYKALGRPSVPQDLYPQQSEKVEMIINAGKPAPQA